MAVCELIIVLCVRACVRACVRRSLSSQPFKGIQVTTTLNVQKEFRNMEMDNGAMEMDVSYYSSMYFLKTFMFR